MFALIVAIDIRGTYSVAAVGVCFPEFPCAHVVVSVCAHSEFVNQENLWEQVVRGVASRVGSTDKPFCNVRPPALPVCYPYLHCVGDIVVSAELSSVQKRAPDTHRHTEGTSDVQHTNLMR